MNKLPYLVSVVLLGLMFSPTRAVKVTPKNINELGFPKNTKVLLATAAKQYSADPIVQAILRKDSTLVKQSTFNSQTVLVINIPNWTYKLNYLMLAIIASFLDKELSLGTFEVIRALIKKGVDLYGQASIRPDDVEPLTTDPIFFAADFGSRQFISGFLDVFLSLGGGAKTATADLIQYLVEIGRAVSTPTKTGIGAKIIE
jgi:hypothetical protein